MHLSLGILRRLQMPCYKVIGDPTPSFKILRLLLRRLPIYDKVEVITRRDIFGENVLCKAVHTRKIAILNVVLEGLTHKQQAQVIIRHNNNTLVYAEQFGEADMLSILLSRLTAEQILHALKRGKEDGMHNFMQRVSRQNLSMTLDRLSSDQQVDLICCQDSRGYNDVMIAVAIHHKELLSEIVGRLSPDQKYASITNQTKELICEDFEVEQQKIGYNALMLAVDFVHVFKEHLSWMQKYQLRLDYHPESMISILLYDLTPDQQLTVMSYYRKTVNIGTRYI